MTYNLQITSSSVSPTQDSSVTGPLADLNQTNFNYNLYQFPTMQDNPSAGHQIIFFINIPQGSAWNNSGTTNSNAPPPVANRFAAASNFGLQQLGTPGQEIMTGNLGSSLENLVLQSKTTRTTTAIGLYIPPTMMFTQTMQYDNVSLTDALGLVGDIHAGLQLINSGNYSAGSTSLLGAVPDLLKGLGNIGDLSGKRNVGLKAAGIADNPQNFLLFKQIDFRKFSFDFILTPENSNDTQVINQIIKLFRFHSAPEVLADSTGRFFIPPSEFDIQIMHNGQLNLNIPQINTCVCNSVSVNYAEAGKWVTYTDGMPVMVKISLQFTETQILTKTLINSGF